MIQLFAILPFFSTSLGGYVALRLRHRLHPIMAFASGVLVATALADLLPEAGELVGAEAGNLVGIAAVVGFLVFSGLEALVHRQTWEHEHPAHADPHAPHEHERPSPVKPTALGIVGPFGLIVHSTLDGLAIGLGFRASNELGLIVALAVLAHDFADGMNVVTLSLAGGAGLRSAIVVLVLDALAPPLGVVLSSIVPLTPLMLGVLLATFSGVFLAVGAGHLLPEAQHREPGAAPSLVLLAGVGAVIVVLIRNAIG